MFKISWGGKALCFVLSFFFLPRSVFSRRWLCGHLINCTSSNTGTTKDVAMGLEEGKTPLKPVLLLNERFVPLRAEVM